MTRTIACVLRQSRVYGPEWVQALSNGLKRYAPGVPLVCLSDALELVEGDEGTCYYRVPGTDVPAIPLEHDWPGWWAKIELFRPGALFGRVLYLDLDTLPVGRLDAFWAYDGPLAMLSDFYTPALLASGVMLFEPDACNFIYHRFVADPVGIMAAHPARSDAFYREVAPHADRVQDLWPGRVFSYKAHARAGIPEDAWLVCGHGQPRFSDRAAGWAHSLWRARAT